MKKSIIVSFLALALIVGGAYALTIQGTQEELAQIELQTIDDFEGGGIDLDKYYLTDGTNTSNASTSPIYQGTSKASSTVTMSIGNAKHIDVNISAKSTSTVPVITWQYFFSSDDGANKNWFSEEGTTVTSNTLLTHGGAGLTHSWTPNATTTIGQTWYRNTQITPVASKYMKIEFDVSGAATDLYVEGISQTEVNN